MYKSGSRFKKSHNTVLTITGLALLGLSLGWPGQLQAGIFDFFTDRNVEKLCQEEPDHTRIEFVEPEIKYITQDSASAIKADSPYKNSQYHTLAGLTSDNPFLKMQINTKTFQQGGSQCMKNSLEAKLGFQSMTIYIAREFAGDECFKEEVLKHEYQHVSIHRKIMKGLEEKVRQTGLQVNRYWMHALPFNYQEPLKGLETHWKEALQEMNRQDEAYDQAYRDSAHLQQACGGRFQQQFMRVRSLGDL